MSDKRVTRPDAKEIVEVASFRSNLFPDDDLIPFLQESLSIEGIHRAPTNNEVEATRRFMALFSMSAVALGDLQAVYAPGHPLRERKGMNVSVGRYVPPAGGPLIARRLQSLCRKVNAGSEPWETHVEFEALHPYMDGNGRTGLALWAWHMHSRGMRPFALPFLHRFYYQTLAARGPFAAARWK